MQVKQPSFADILVLKRSLNVTLQKLPWLNVSLQKELLEQETPAHLWLLQWSQEAAQQAEHTEIPAGVRN